MGGFGVGLGNVFRGDPSLITTDVERFRTVSADLLQSVARGYLAEHPRVELSVVGRKKAAVAAQLDRSVVPASGRGGELLAAEAPQISTLACGIPLWVFPRRDLPTVAGSIVVAGGASHQQLSQAGLAQLTTSMLEEGTRSRTVMQIALAAESMGQRSRRAVVGRHVSFKCLKGDLSASLELAVDILLNPTFPEAEWQRVRGQTLAALRAERDHAEPRAYLSSRRRSTPRTTPTSFRWLEPRRASPTARGDLVQFRRVRFLIAGRSTINAGIVDPPALAAELEERLTSWTDRRATCRSIRPASDPRIRA